MLHLPQNTLFVVDGQVSLTLTMEIHIYPIWNAMTLFQTLPMHIMDFCPNKNLTNKFEDTFMK